MKNSILLVGLVVALSACANPIVGSWESKDKIGDKKNEMTLEADGDKITGNADVYFYIDEVFVHATYEVEGKDKGDGEYKLTISCKTACSMANASDCAPSEYLSGFDTELDCELSSDETEMDCEADGKFSTYKFEWEKTE